jgi:DNA-binding PadR family transcriptional regulator
MSPIGRSRDSGETDAESRQRILAIVGEDGLSGFEIARRLAGVTPATAWRDESGLYPSLHHLEAGRRLRAAWAPTASGEMRRTYRRTVR